MEWMQLAKALTFTLASLTLMYIGIKWLIRRNDYGDSSKQL